MTVFLAPAQRASTDPEPGDDPLDLAPALVAGCREQVAVVAIREVRREEPDGSEVNRAVGEEVENRREATGGSGDLDPVVGGVLGIVEPFREKAEERWKALGKVELARVKLGEVDNERGRGLALAGGHAVDLREKIAIGDVYE